MSVCSDWLTFLLYLTIAPSLPTYVRSSTETDLTVVTRYFVFNGDFKPPGNVHMLAAYVLHLSENLRRA